MVMTWYKYGNEPRTITCVPAGTVSKDLNISQLKNNMLKFDFAPYGEEAEYLEITAVSVSEADGVPQNVESSGEIEIKIPEGTSGKKYTFVVNAKYSKRNAKNEQEEYETTFTYVLKCSYAMDLELELNWSQMDGSYVQLPCAANKKVMRTLNSSTLVEGNKFSYNTTLTGALANNAKIVDANYREATGSAVQTGAQSGMIIMRADEVTGETKYIITFTVEIKASDGETDTVTYTFEIVYKQSLDIKMVFTWLEGGSVPVNKECLPNKSINIDVKNNQLSAGSVIYEIKFDGDNAESARVLNVTYVSDGSGGGSLQQSGALPMSIPSGYTYNTYTVNVSVLAEGQRMMFTVKIKYMLDISLNMEYMVAGEKQIVTCENGRTVQASEIYRNQLDDDKLEYKMSITGGDVTDAEIKEVKCFQSGSGRTTVLDKEGEIALLLKHDGNGYKTGENTFYVTATDYTGKIYEFKINIKYKNNGEGTVKIATNLDTVDKLINDTVTNLNVRAWSEDAQGNVLQYILSTGVDTKLIVKFDGEEITGTKASGVAQEYYLNPKSDAAKDTNTHTLYIYAEDEYGNSGDVELTFTGVRSMEGMPEGTVTICVDMAALGIEEVVTLQYEILTKEPVSYVVAKAIMGQDTERFGKAENNLGWSGRHTGTLDEDYFLASLTPYGYDANTLEDRNWPGSTKEEVLRNIDNRFSNNPGLARLWRCIYINGLTKGSSSGDGSYGQKDFTEGSGWFYTINGDYYPGDGMSNVYLHNNDVLTLRYSLAWGWDIGNTNSAWGNDKGYCVQAIDGRIHLKDHNPETVTIDGKTVTRCKSCWMIEECGHENKFYKEIDDYWHVHYCPDCKKELDVQRQHEWVCEKTEDGVGADIDIEEYHFCADCGKEQKHKMKLVTDTATCTVGGELTEECTVCKFTHTEESPPAGHKLGGEGTWFQDTTTHEHYQKCSVEGCGEIIERGKHKYVYNSSADWFECQICDVPHDPIFGSCDGDLVKTSETCQHIVYHCDKCGCDMTQNGNFEDKHNYINGNCEYCGKAENGGNSGSPDSGSPDSGSPDSGSPDSGSPDSGNPDSGSPDSGNPDSGSPDSGSPDSGSPDSGSPDSSSPDSG
ncbi:MAG: hypothetical protein IKK99_03945, partial [Oscillospiraceae bacterium]|nr:hypothetical protein [Oscillospiraceae bacterium]